MNLGKKTENIKFNRGNVFSRRLRNKKEWIIDAFPFCTRCPSITVLLGECKSTSVHFIHVWRNFHSTISQCLLRKNALQKACSLLAPLRLVMYWVLSPLVWPCKERKGHRMNISRALSLAEILRLLTLQRTRVTKASKPLQKPMCSF